MTDQEFQEIENQFQSLCKLLPVDFNIYQWEAYLKFEEFKKQRLETAKSEDKYKKFFI